MRKLFAPLIIVWTWGWSLAFSRIPESTWGTLRLILLLSDPMIKPMQRRWQAFQKFISSGLGRGVAIFGYVVALINLVLTVCFSAPAANQVSVTLFQLQSNNISVQFGILGFCARSKGANSLSMTPFCSSSGLGYNYNSSLAEVLHVSSGTDIIPTVWLSGSIALLAIGVSPMFPCLIKYCSIDIKRHRARNNHRRILYRNPCRTQLEAA
ncbi:hypothetical protein C8Q74DRAFT_415965 [Fomes fomentarius]|nr:hypothetical protein C8Q74DRAFT_415965 [Fomes fomentarius]